VPGLWSGRRRRLLIDKPGLGKQDASPTGTDNSPEQQQQQQQQVLEQGRPALLVQHVTKVVLLSRPADPSQVGFWWYKLARGPLEPAAAAAAAASGCRQELCARLAAAGVPLSPDSFTVDIRSSSGGSDIDQQAMDMAAAAGQASEAGSGNDAAGVIAGAVVGAVVGAALLVLLVVFRKRLAAGWEQRNKKRSDGDAAAAGRRSAVPAAVAAAAAAARSASSSRQVPGSRQQQLKPEGSLKQQQQSQEPPDQAGCITACRQGWQRSSC